MLQQEKWKYRACLCGVFLALAFYSCNLVNLIFARPIGEVRLKLNAEDKHDKGKVKNVQGFVSDLQLYPFPNDLFFSLLPALPLNDTPEIELSSFHTYYMISIPLQNRLYYCQYLKPPHGLGNILNQYWLARSYAFYNNQEFVMVGCGQNGVSEEEERQLFSLPCRCDIYNASHNFVGHLPHFSNATIRQLVRQRFGAESSTLETFEKFFKQFLEVHLMIDLNVHAKVYPTSYFFVNNPSPLLFSYMNYLFQSLFVIPESLQGLDTFFGTNVYRNDPSLVTQKNLQGEYMAIHFRCGDVFGRGVSSAYGFLGMSFYRQIFQYWDKVLGKFKKNLKHIFIVTQLDRSLMNSWHAVHAQKCTFMVQKFVEAIRTNVLEPMFGTNGRSPQIHVIGNGTINGDYWVLSHAKYLICGISSFCVHGALMNPYGRCALAVNTLDALLQYNIPLRNIQQFWSGKFRMASGNGRWISDRFALVEHTTYDKQMSRLITGSVLREKNYTIDAIVEFMLEN
ncbi:hypothetical protein RFI_12604 [Reticulomyxa filosa]|uniref:Uncharacterized protein n=1 Tax=Reticulomyxa filosa TaxID=46433 RepID=X6NGR3_RETFI|nr:hypothetical protein RFI_12604 [Reticulomyxa filosa]|eukprot:ETO24552.1 hypothetical protein RFI_12604 [Reticulomyxa filosa]